jgi:hypothetical protein
MKLLSYVQSMFHSNKQCCDIFRKELMRRENIIKELRSEIASLVQDFKNFKYPKLKIYTQFKEDVKANIDAINSSYDESENIKYIKAINIFKTKLVDVGVLQGLILDDNLNYIAINEHIKTIYNKHYKSNKEMICFLVNENYNLGNVCNTDDIDNTDNTDCILDHFDSKHFSHYTSNYKVVMDEDSFNNILLYLIKNKWNKSITSLLASYGFKYDVHDTILKENEALGKYCQIRCKLDEIIKPSRITNKKDLERCITRISKIKKKIGEVGIKYYTKKLLENYRGKGSEIEQDMVLSNRKIKDLIELEKNEMVCELLDEILEDQVIEECSICLEHIYTINYFKTKCNHYYHKKCYEAWSKINPTCPLCRLDMI